MKRANTILMIILAGQLLLFGLIITTCGQESNRIEPVTILDGLERSAISRITIEAKNGDKTDKAVLEKKNDDWILPKQFGYMADKSKVDKLLGTLLGLQSSRIISRGAEHREDLKVADDSFQRRVVLEAGGVKRTMWVGSTAAGSSTCVRVDNKQETYASSDIKAWDLNARASAWLAQPYLQIQSPRLANITIEGPKGKLELNRTALDDWKLQGKNAETSEVDKLLDKLEKVNITAVEGKAEDGKIAEQLKSAEKRWTISLALAEQDLPASAPKPANQDTTGDTSADTKTPAVQQDQLEDKAQAPNISERIVLEIATRAGHKYDLLLHKKGDPYVVVVSQYSLKSLTDADAEKLLGEKKDK